MKLAMTNFSLKLPWLVIVAVIAVCGLFIVQYPKVNFDNDPENMLSKNEDIRVFHNAVKEKYRLYDFVIVGIVNDIHRNGIFNVDTLGKIDQLTSDLINLRRGDDGFPEVPRKGGEVIKLDLSAKGAWARTLAKAFRQNSNLLFDENGDSVIITPEIISPSVVDNIKQADMGSLKLEYLMEKPPVTEEEALVIRDDAMGNPLYKGTLVSEDEKAICIYIPIKAKTYSYNVASLVKRLTQDWRGDEQVFITGQPVAQDTFGVEMLVQMATSAPLAGLAIFLLLLLFFKRVSLIVAPMLVAVISVICTMGLLIGGGHDVHIMSSMIAIFLMPIAVADSVHILSEFFDLYHRFNDRAETMRHVINHLFKPMLYTSMTTFAGFASLAITPIPPVRVFGLHVAFGVALAWFLTMTFIPAFVMVAVPQSTLDAISHDDHREKQKNSPLNGLMEWLGLFGYRRWKLIIAVTAVVFVLSMVGLFRIRVNDNPVKWFTKSHDIRVADKVLNHHFGGTYTAYLTLKGTNEETSGTKSVLDSVKDGAKAYFGPDYKAKVDRFRAEVDALSISDESSKAEVFEQVRTVAKAIDKESVEPWNILADEINYLEPEGLTLEKMTLLLGKQKGAGASPAGALLERLARNGGLSGEVLMDKALELCDLMKPKSFAGYLDKKEIVLSAPLFKRPDVLRYVEELQAHIVGSDVVGKTSSAVDALKKASYELQYAAPPSGATEDVVKAVMSKNEKNRDIPATPAAIGQVFSQLEGMKKTESLFHLVTSDYTEANIWVQLKSGDNVDMQAVAADLEDYFARNRPPADIEYGWAGLTYLNVVWQKKMVKGMFSSLSSSFIVVLIMMIVLFRSPLFGFLSMVPLSITILFIYGLICWVGKDYDMPVAVLSALTLGLSVDFAIHFLERAREEQKKTGSWKEASMQMFKEPAMAISRNAITISIGFTPLLVAPLVPYKTVGFFLATIMAVSWLATLFILPAVLTMLKKYAFKSEG